MLVPPLSLGLVHAVVFRRAVPIGARQLDVASLVLPQLGVVGPIEVTIDLHLVFCQGATAVRVLVEQAGRLGDLHVVERAKMTQCRCKRAVRRLVLAHQEKGPRLVATIQPGQRLVGHKIGHVAGETLPLAAHLDKHGIVVVALPGQDLPVIETNRPSLQMPLADHRSVITARLKCLGDGPLTLIQPPPRIPHESVRVAVLAGQNRRS